MIIKKSYTNHLSFRESCTNFIPWCIFCCLFTLKSFSIFGQISNKRYPSGGGYFISHFVPIDLSYICNDVYLDNRHRSKGKIYVSDLFIFTVIGWIVSLVMSFASRMSKKYCVMFLTNKMIPRTVCILCNSVEG